MSLILARLLSPSQFGQFAFVSAVYSILLVLIPGATGMTQVLLSGGNNDETLFYKIRYLVLRFLIVESTVGALLCLYFFFSKANLLRDG